MTYYGERAARDPAWHERQLREAAERERRRWERDPDSFRERHREATARCRERQHEHGLTFAQLRERCLTDGYPSAEETLRRVLQDEVDSGRIEYHSTSRRSLLNGGLDAATVAALRSLSPPAPSSSPPAPTRRRLRRDSAGAIAAHWPELLGRGRGAIAGTRGAPADTA